MNFLVRPTAGLRGSLRVAGDKSISHRSVILGSIANGLTSVSGILEGEDVLATIAAFRAMGVPITRTEEPVAGPCYLIEGQGLYGLSRPDGPLDMGNSGTAFRLLAGLLSAQKWPVTLVGDESLSARPMIRIIEPLVAMGALLSSRNGLPPVEISPVDALNGIHYHTPMASAQVKSAVLLAGLYARGTTAVTESVPTRDHTERMLKGFGYPVRVDGSTVAIAGNGILKGQEIDVPADLSSAAFFVLAALISVDSKLVLEKVGNNPSRNGVIAILRRMGGQIDLSNETLAGGEPVADFTVSSSRLNGCELNAADVASAIDEIPVIAIAAACAEGVTRITGASELRVKESDRIRSVVNGLQSLGVVVEEFDDGMEISGGKIHGGHVDSMGDHRIAMAFAMAGIVASSPVTVADCENVATSFPYFIELANKAGVTVIVDQ
jgi:3-phosphoshikimate 1-carboxyvinyltransferase